MIGDQWTDGDYHKTLLPRFTAATALRIMVVNTACGRAGEMHHHDGHDGHSSTNVILLKYPNTRDMTDLFQIMERLVDSWISTVFPLLW